MLFAAAIAVDQVLVAILSLLALGALGAVGGVASSAVQGAFNAAEARRNRKFQEKMYRHRHQYQVEDLRKAGLNPILSAGGAPPGPAGSTASISSPDIGGGAVRGVSTALAHRRNQAEIDLLEEQADKAHQEANRAHTSSLVDQEHARNLVLQRHRMAYTLPGAELEARWNTMLNDTMGAFGVPAAGALSTASKLGTGLLMRGLGRGSPRYLTNAQRRAMRRNSRIGAR